MRVRVALTVVACLAVTGCGGGGGSSTPTQTPAPTPVPTPTPTPPPPPPVPTPTVYEIAFDFSRDRFFNLFGAELSGTLDGRVSPGGYTAITSTLQEDSAGVQLTYTAAMQQAALTIGNRGPILFPQSQITLNQADRLVFVGPDSTLSIGRLGPDLGQFPAPLNYVISLVQTSGVRNISLDIDTVSRRYIGGSATQPQDVPTTGSATYSTLIASVSLDPAKSESATGQRGELAIDFALNRLGATLVLTSAAATPVSTSLTFAGQLNPATGRLTGTVTGPDGLTGPFYGRLFGPAGVEFGVAFNLARGNQRVIGTVIGVKR